MTDNDATQTRQDDATKQLRAMLDEFIHDLEDLDIWLDNPASEMTLGEYEHARKKLVESCTEQIAATVTQDLFIHKSGMNEQTCTVESMHGYTDAHVSTRYFVELSCHTIDDWGDSKPPVFCPYCGRKVIDQDARDLRDAIATDDGKRYSMQEVMDLMEGE